VQRLINSSRLKIILYIDSSKRTCVFITINSLIFILKLIFKNILKVFRRVSIDRIKYKMSKDKFDSIRRHIFVSITSYIDVREKELSA